MIVIQNDKHPEPLLPFRLTQTPVDTILYHHTIRKLWILFALYRQVNNADFRQSQRLSIKVNLGIFSFAYHW